MPSILGFLPTPLPSTTVMATVDYTKPLATLLRESTHEAHDQVAMSTGAKRLLSGQLSRDEYVRYLMMLWHVYNTFEQALDRYATNPALEPTYNPALLARAPALSADIAHLLQVDESAWKTHYIHTQLLKSAPAGLTEYVERINTIANSIDPSALLAHSYVRYLGDLSGGQTIRHILAKAYNLDEAAGFGVSFYAFKELQSAKPANQGEMKRIKEWFREGMNTAGEQGVVVKIAVVEEAKRAFVLNAGLFTVLDVEEHFPEPEVVPAPADKTFPVSQAIGVVAAICLAHFLLVLGGFTGPSGYEKLLAAEQWVAQVFSQTK